MSGKALSWYLSYFGYALGNAKPRADALRKGTYEVKLYTLYIMPLILLISLAASFSQAQVPGMALDQSNNNYGFYFNSRYSGWQSYAAGANGNLGSVQLWLYSTGTESGYSGGADWSATLRIREGEAFAKPKEWLLYRKERIPGPESFVSCLCCSIYSSNH